MATHMFRVISMLRKTQEGPHLLSLVDLEAQFEQEVKGPAELQTAGWGIAFPTTHSGAPSLRLGLKLPKEISVQLLSDHTAYSA